MEIGSIPDFKGVENLALFLAFFIPGFITMQGYYFFIPTRRPDLSKQIPVVVAYSAMHYAATLWIVLLLRPPYAIAAGYIIVFVLHLFGLFWRSCFEIRVLMMKRAL